MQKLLVVLVVAMSWLCAVSASAEMQFIIFFSEGDREQLDPEQWRVIPEGVAVVKDAAAAQKAKGAFILLIGNDQNVGSTADAFVRSRRRAEAVRDLLMRSGVAGSMITVKACGFGKPLVERPKGVSETQNRYVIFDFRRSQSEVTAAANAVCPGE